MATTLDARAPPALRRLHALFSSIEFGLSSLALYQRTPDWDAVKRAVESSSQTTLAKEDLQQLLWLAPEAYALAWSSRPPSRKRARAAGAADADDRDTEAPQLLVRRQRLTHVAESDASDAAPPPAAETLTDRIEWFTKLLNALVDGAAAKRRGEDDKDEEDAAIELDIGHAALPEPPSVSAQQPHHARLDEIAKKTARDVSTSAQLAAALAAPVPEDLQTLPKWLIDKVRRQEQQSKRAAQRTDAAQKQRLHATLPQLSDQVQSLVLVQRKHVFPLAEMVRQLRTKAPVRDAIEEQIHLLETMVPFWLTVFFSDGKQYVRLSKNHKYNAVKAALRKALATAD